MIARLAGAALLWAVTLVGTRWVLDDESSSRAARLAAVAVALAGVLPWIWMTSRAILREDEFTRRVHFVALSWAFAATGLFIYAVDLLTGAHLINYVSYTTIWIFMVVAWWLSIVITTRYYR
jgi:hypothetical protein